MSKTWAYGPNLGWGGGAQYWFARPLCVMLHSTHVYNFVRELWFARMTHGFQLNCPTFKKKFLGGAIRLWSKIIAECEDF